jgi:hypothetical protein
MSLRRVAIGIKWTGIGLIALSLLLGFTPIHWYVERAIHGVPDEYYPELFWLYIGLPISVAVTMVGSRLVRMTSQPRRTS